MKTSELIGPALDWAVAKCEDMLDQYDDCWIEYSTNWKQGGPIIERENICIGIDGDDGGWEWEAETAWLSKSTKRFGSTPLIAAMRCYVTSKLGDEVDIPEELK
jgi:hypothetical protein